MIKQNEQRRKDNIRGKLAEIVKSAKAINVLMKDVPHNEDGIVIEQIHTPQGDKDYLFHSIENKNIYSLYTDNKGVEYSISVIRKPVGDSW